MAASERFTWSGFRSVGDNHYVVAPSGAATHSADFADDDGGDGHWVTIDGNHIFIGASGRATKGPSALVKALNEDTLKPGTKVQVEQAEHVPEHVKDALREIPNDADPHGDGSLARPIQVGADLDQALRLIADGKHVRLDQPQQVSTLLDKLAAQAVDAQAKGDKAPNYDLGLVSVTGTNLFTQESKGVPRVEMPQLSGKPTPGSPAARIVGPNGNADLAPALVDSLRQMGVRVEGTYVPAATLRASQSELNGAKVAAMTQAMKAGTMKSQPIFVTRDHYVVDGHHRWAAKIGIDAANNRLGDVRMPVYKVNLDIGAMLDYSRAFASKMGIPQASVFARLRRALAALLARFAGGGGGDGHWVTLDDGRHVFIEESSGHPRGGTNQGEPPLGAPLGPKDALQYLRQPTPHYDMNQEEVLVAEAVPLQPVVSLVDLDQQTIHPQLTALAEVSQDYPQAARVLDYVGVYNGQDQPRSANGGGPVYWSGPAYAELAAVQPAGQRAMGFNPMFFNPNYGHGVPSVDMNQEMAHNVETGWFPPQASNPGYIAVHEYGHVIASDLAAHDPDAFRVWQLTTDPAMRLRGQDSSISQYAATGARGLPNSASTERLAEAFAGYYFGSTHWQAQATGDVLRQAYGRAPTYLSRDDAPATHPAGARGTSPPATTRRAAAHHSALFDGDGHWVTLDDGRHVFIDEGSGIEGRYPGAVVGAVRQLRTQAAQAEPQTTALLQDVAANHGGHMEGLKFRLKGEERLAEKIHDRAALTNQTPDEAAQGIGDALRYTMVLAPDDYTAGAKATVTALKAAGYQAKVDNFWWPGDAYNGLHADLVSPNGQKVELQFHTPESFALKMDVLHGDYDVARTLSNPTPVRYAAFQRMQAVSDKLPMPRGILTFGRPRTKPFK